MIKLVVQMIFLIKALNHYKLYSYCTKRLSIKLLSRVFSLLVRDSRVHRAHLISGAYQRIRAMLFWCNWKINYMYENVFITVRQWRIIFLERLDMKQAKICSFGGVFELHSTLFRYQALPGTHGHQTDLNHLCRHPKIPWNHLKQYLATKFLETCHKKYLSRDRFRARLVLDTNVYSYPWTETDCTSLALFQS